MFSFLSNHPFWVALLMLLSIPRAAIGQVSAPAKEQNSVVDDNSLSNDISSMHSARQDQSALSDVVLIGSGDLLDIRVLGAPDYVAQVRVGDDGQIVLPFIGFVKVAGLSVNQAEPLIAKRLADGGFFNDPQVSVLQKEYATQGIDVLGEVQRPGIFPLLGHRTLFDAVSAAGGFTQKSGKTAVITHRDRPDEPETVRLDYDAKNSPQSNIPLLPGDTVVVSRAGLAYVVGDVGNPTGIVLEDSGLTVLQAIAMAQGAKPTAALDKAKLIRKTSDGQQEIPLNLKKILSAKAPDAKLQAEDIVFVPSSFGKTASRRGLEAIVQAATGVVIFAHY